MKLRKPKIKSDNIFVLFCGCLIKNGKKIQAYKLFLYILAQIRLKLKINPFFVIESVIRRTRPIVYYKSKKKRNFSYYVPSLITLRQANFLAIKWILKHSETRIEKKREQRILGEILNLYSSKGNSYKKKQEIYSIVSNNQANVRKYK